VLPALEEKAVQFIRASAKSGKPFFLYFPLTSPHNPIAPTAQFLGKSGLNKYADFIMQTDSVVGSVLRALDESGVTENTIVIFTSDNGVTTLSDIPFMTARGHHSSYKFRNHKASIYDGGHRIPCVMQWPARLKPAQIPQTICLNDFIATFAELLGHTFTDAEAEDSFSLMPLLFPRSETNKKTAYQRDSLVHHSVDGSFAIRRGKWKLIFTPGNGQNLQGKNRAKAKNLSKYNRADRFQLYDMEADIAETTNLHARHPEIAKQLKSLLIACIEQGRSTPGAPQPNDVPYPDQYMQWRQYD
jgi:arylsulfatase A-like enzyme